MVRASSAAISLAFLAQACVAETTVIGEDRARIACTEAWVLEAPSAGCVPIESIVLDGPWGCEAADATGRVDPRDGTWLRVRSAPGRAATLRVLLTDAPSLCGEGRHCPAAIVSDPGEGRCTCGAHASTQFLGVGVESAVELPPGESTVLLQPPGGTFALQICTDGASAYPPCRRAVERPCPLGSTTYHEGEHCVCLPPCTSIGGCPGSTDGTPVCEPDRYCTLRCDRGEPCPTGLRCIALESGAALCMWPE